MPYTMQGCSVVFLIALEGIKRAEFLDPWRAVQEAGGTPELMAARPDMLRAFDHEENQITMRVKQGTHDASADVYDGLVLTGSGVDSETLHADPHALRLVRDFIAQGKPVAAIGESVETLAKADVVRGRRVSVTPTFEAQLRDAGAECVEEQVVVDDGLVTSRNLDDVPAFCQKLVEEFGKETSLTVD